MLLFVLIQANLPALAVDRNLKSYIETIQKSDNDKSTSDKPKEPKKNGDESPPESPFTLRLYTIDPQATGLVRAMYVQREHRQVILLQKGATTTSVAASGGIIQNVEGLKPTSCGFDKFVPTGCGSEGSPAMVLVTKDRSGNETSHLALCANGVVEKAVGNWVTLTFDVGNPTQVFPTVNSGDTLTDVTVVMYDGYDTGNGVTFVDNIRLNGQLVKELRSPSIKL